MKVCRVMTPQGPSFGHVVDDVIVLVDGNPITGEWRERADRLPLADAHLLPPTIPLTFFCAGLNYARHIEEAAKKGYKAAKLPERPDVGHRAQNALIGHGQAIVKPREVEGRFEYEGELVAVIGRTLKKVSREEAQAGIFGWTIGNDVSARNWQNNDRTFWRGKNADTFKPMGPWIDTEAQPMGGQTKIYVNGVEKTRFSTGEMIFDPIDFITEISRYVTLHPGDVLWLGTDGPGAIAPGDTVSIEIEGLATLTNPVVEEDA